MKKIVSLFLIFSFLFCQSSVLAKPFKRLSQLEIRDTQTHVFACPNTNEVFKATINTLQDDGFIIENIEDGLGYIKARKEYKAKRTDKKRATLYSLLLACSIASIALGDPAGGAQSMTDAILRLNNEISPKTVVVDANANIEPFGKQTRVRLTMVEKVLYNADGYSYIKSSPRNVIRIYNRQTYQEFFSELDKSIFYENI